MKPQPVWFLAFGLVVAIVLAASSAFLSSMRGSGDHSYSELLAKAASGGVESIFQQDRQLTVHITGEAEPWTVFVGSTSVNAYAEVCEAAGTPLGQCAIAYDVAEPSPGGQFLGLFISSLLPVVLIGSFIYFMMRQQRGQKP